MDLLTVVVDGLWRQGSRSLAVRLVAQDGQPLPDWQPGAHIDLHLPCGLIRQYSLTGPEGADEGYLICVALESASRGGSRYIHQQLRPGQTLLISRPRNLFALQTAERVTLLAAGIGITPLYAMALRLEADGVPFTLHYYLKHPQQGAFVRELRQRFGADQCHIHSSSEGQSARQHLCVALAEPLPGHCVYLCGPEGFMASARRVAREKGWPDEQIHSEAFQPVALETNTQGDDTFRITLASSGEQWPVPPDKTIAQVLQENGVDIPLSCEMGICGACLTPVIEGIVDHRDTVQSEAEKSASAQQIALCCSRSRSANLCLDL
ncbi:PDR/VanB family oxidoreductase [Pseudenterobacter timonensis]|uniref:PDR/VanB family oxidoreductase n=1 Tax=Pseudenterobacter timonensis TaxID=1755099 RepID=A0AAE4DQE2_9ENTR|nr:PDR/VanB family oxidoreductase [Pseudenterobacter timonensis]MDR9891614.1 PDR/VanB family oxidoreductase [Pseudenterobacter timonensis]